MSETPARVRFVTALVADDIRREVSGKEIIIGVYTSKIIVGAISPDGGMVLAVSILFEALGVGDIPIEVQIVGPSGEAFHPKAILHSTESTQPKQINSFSITAVPIPIPAVGAITVRARQYEEEWELIRNIPVVVNPDEPGLAAGIPRVSAIEFERPSSQSPPGSPEPSSPLKPPRPARPTRRRRS